VTPRRAGAWGLLILAAVLVFVFRMSAEMRDFEVYWVGSVDAAAGQPLYREDAGHYVYKYFPSFAVLAIPLGLMPLAVAKAVWFAASVVLLVLFLKVCREILPRQRKSTVFIVAAVVVALGKFFGRELVLGQANLLFGALAIWAVLAMKHGRETLAGVLLGFTIAVKPYGVLFLPWLVARKQRDSILAAALTLGVIVLLPIPFYGVGGTIGLYRDWWATVTETTASTLTGQDSISFASMYAKWLSAGPLAAALAVFTSIAALAMAAAVFSRRSAIVFPEALEAGLLLMLVPMLSPQGWDYMLLLSAPAIVLLANDADRLPKAMRILAIVAVLTMGLSLYDLMGRRAYAAFMALAPISVCAIVLMVALYVTRERKIA
jgi:hypothetical protein